MPHGDTHYFSIFNSRIHAETHPNPRKSNNKTTKSFKKIAPTFQKMLLIASSRESRIILINLNNDDAVILFKQSPVLYAQMFINSLLESQTIDCTISSGLTTSLLKPPIVFMSSSLLYIDSFNSMHAHTYRLTQ